MQMDAGKELSTQVFALAAQQHLLHLKMNSLRALPSFQTVTVMIMIDILYNISGYYMPGSGLSTSHTCLILTTIVIELLEKLSEEIEAD